MADTNPPAAKTAGARKSRAWIAIVVALVVVVSAIAAYVLLVPRPPSVGLGPVVPLGSGSGYIINVTRADPAEPLSDYEAVLASEATIEGRLSPLVNGSANGSLVFFDVDENGRLNGGDAFGIGPLQDGNHTLTVRWRSSPVASRSFVTETRPVVVFASPTASLDSFEFDVAGASVAVSISMYRIDLVVNGSASNSPTLSQSMTLTVGASTYIVTYTDIAGEGSLTAGDHFRVARSGGLPPNTAFVFRLLWSDGSQIATLTYNT